MLIEKFNHMDQLKTGRFENPLVGRHVENSLRISNMASRGKTHTFGRHVANVPKVGCHVVNELGQF